MHTKVMDRTRKPGWTDRSTDRQQTAIVTTMSSSPQAGSTKRTHKFVDLIMNH